MKQKISEKRHPRRCVDCKKKKLGRIMNIDKQFRCDDCRESILRHRDWDDGEDWDYS